MATFTLSTLDRGAPRAYIRYALTFACNADQSAAATEKLQKAVKSLVSEIPMLAGTITTIEQDNPTVTVTLQQVNDFQAIIAHLETNRLNYAAVRRQSVPPKWISEIETTPFANDFIDDSNPCCAVQANFIDGGLILVIYLHSAIADIRGMTTILRLMSEGLPLRKLNQESLELEAASVSQARARLSDGAGAPAFLAMARDLEQRRQQSMQEPNQESDEGTTTAHEDAPNPGAASNRAAVLRFKLPILVETTAMINSRRALRNPNTTDKISLRDVMIAIMWRAYARARWPNGGADGVKTSVSFPVDVRSHLVPPLEPHWMGNVEMTATANEDLLLLSTHYDLSNLERTANVVHSAVASASSDLLVRSRIEMMNASESLQDLPEAQLVIHDWTSVPMMPGQEMDLGLGLGRPDAIRRTGQGFGRNEVVLLPVNGYLQVWEVQVELNRDWMAEMLGDESLRGFLLSVAR